MDASIGHLLVLSGFLGRAGGKDRVVLVTCRYISGDLDCFGGFGIYCGDGDDCCVGGALERKGRDGS